MSRTALYLRISRDSDKIGRGVARQLTECQALAARDGLEIVATFEDNDISASSFGGRARPAFEQMLERAQAGEFDTLLAWDMDRLVRKPTDGERIIALNKKRKLNVRTVFDTVDLSSPNGEMFFRIKNAVSAQESELKSQRIRAARRQTLAEGKPLPGKRVYGWKAGGMEPEALEAQAIQEGVAHILAGGSISSLVRTWNQSGLTGPTGAAWTASSAKKVLRRWRNAGLLEHHGEILEGQSLIAPLVSRADLEELRLKLELQPSATGRPVTKSWLSGVMRCEVCNGKMLPKKEHYMCSTQTERTRVAGDVERHVSIMKHLAEERVMMALYFEHNYRARNGGVEEAGVDRVREIEAELVEAQRDRREATGMLFVRGVDKAAVQAELSRLADVIEGLEKERLESRTASSEAARIAALMDGPQGVGTEFTAAWIEYFDGLTIEEKRDLARTLDVTVTRGGKGAKRLAILGEAGKHEYVAVR